MANNKQLYRSVTDRQWAGVAGGLAAYFQVDPALVRLAFVLFTLLGGPGLLIYIILWLVIPEEPRSEFIYEKPKNDQVF
jgi:phage shock protein PspC (stress-responsive transcriptional regulator)